MSSAWKSSPDVFFSLHGAPAQPSSQHLETSPFLRDAWEESQALPCQTNDARREEDDPTTIPSQSSLFDDRNLRQVVDHIQIPRQIENEQAAAPGALFSTPATTARLPSHFSNSLATTTTTAAAAGAPSCSVSSSVSSSSPPYAYRSRSAPTAMVPRTAPAPDPKLIAPLSRCENVLFTAAPHEAEEPHMHRPRGMAMGSGEEARRHGDVLPSRKSVHTSEEAVELDVTASAPTLADVAAPHSHPPSPPQCPLSPPEESRSSPAQPASRILKMVSFSSQSCSPLSASTPDGNPPSSQPPPPQQQPPQVPPAGGNALYERANVSHRPTWMSHDTSSNVCHYAAPHCNPAHSRVGYVSRSTTSVPHAPPQWSTDPEPPGGDGDGSDALESSSPAHCTGLMTTGSRVPPPKSGTRRKFPGEARDDVSSPHRPSGSLSRHGTRWEEEWSGGSEGPLDNGVEVKWGDREEAALEWFGGVRRPILRPPPPLSSHPRQHSRLWSGSRAGDEGAAGSVGEDDLARGEREPRRSVGEVSSSCIEEVESGVATTQAESTTQQPFVVEDSAGELHYGCDVIGMGGDRGARVYRIPPNRLAEWNIPTRKPKALAYKLYRDPVPENELTFVRSANLQHYQQDADSLTLYGFLHLALPLGYVWVNGAVQGLLMEEYPYSLNYFLKQRSSATKRRVDGNSTGLREGGDEGLLEEEAESFSEEHSSFLSTPSFAPVRSADVITALAFQLLTAIRVCNDVVQQQHEGGETGSTGSGSVGSRRFRCLPTPSSIPRTRSAAATTRSNNNALTPMSLLGEEGGEDGDTSEDRLSLSAPPHHGFALNASTGTTTDGDDVEEDLSDTDDSQEDEDEERENHGVTLESVPFDPSSEVVHPFPSTQVFCRGNALPVPLSEVALHPPTPRPASPSAVPTATYCRGAEGFTHNDIHLDNILVSHHGHLALCDFELVFPLPCADCGGLGGGIAASSPHSRTVSCSGVLSGRRPGASAAGSPRSMSSRLTSSCSRPSHPAPPHRHLSPCHTRIPAFSRQSPDGLRAVNADVWAFGLVVLALLTGVDPLFAEEDLRNDFGPGPILKKCTETMNSVDWERNIKAHVESLLAVHPEGNGGGEASASHPATLSSLEAKGLLHLCSLCLVNAPGKQSATAHQLLQEPLFDEYRVTPYRAEKVVERWIAQSHH